MEIKDYFDQLEENFKQCYSIAASARSKGYDPMLSVEISPASDLASRVEGIIGFPGIAQLIRAKTNVKNRQELAFEVVKDICTEERFKADIKKRIALAVRVGLSILTEGILVAPTEGINGIEIYKHADGSEYVAIVFAGPIRSAGGTSVALSVAFTDYARKLLGVGRYKPQQSEMERYIEEIYLYDSRMHRLQYKAPEEDLRSIISNCPVCIDSLPTEKLEISVHRDIKRFDQSGNEVLITNRVRGALGLVISEGIAAKAKSVLKYTKGAGLDWSWLNNVIKVEKKSSDLASSGSKSPEHHFLQELVAGRPIISYPSHSGGLRLRYGRSRLTGIAAKGISPATMELLDGFIVTGTQLRIETPGKGCVAMPVDSIEGPFVKLKSGEAFRVNTIEQAKKIKDSVDKILSVGDILITYGDFKKSNTALLPTSYVEEYWHLQLKRSGYTGKIIDTDEISFKEAYKLSVEYDVAMHPLYTYDFADLTSSEITDIMHAILNAKIQINEQSLFNVQSIELDSNIRSAIERLCIPHFDDNNTIRIKSDHAQSLICSLGLLDISNKSDPKLMIDRSIIERYDNQKDPLELVNSLSAVKIMKRATRIGGRMGRPEKAGERLMKPSPNVLFPVGDYGGRERSVYKAYLAAQKKFGYNGIDVQIARYRCENGGEIVEIAHCRKHDCRANIERICAACGRKNKDGISECAYCSAKIKEPDRRSLDILEILNSASKNTGLTIEKTLKGVKGLSNTGKIAEAMEKGLIRAKHGVHIFKDGTCRFDSTDAPITHFYPIEIGTDVDTLKKLGYDKDYLGNELTSNTQIVELMHQDVIINRRGGEFMLKVSKFVDEMLMRLYGLDPFYNSNSINDLIGQLVLTLSPHTSASVLCRIIGFTNANVGFAHPYIICARRRNCDGDEDSLMLLMDALINFSRQYLPSTVGSTMDAPLLLTVHVKPEEVDDEVHEMEVVYDYGIDFYDQTLQRVQPSEASVELVSNRLNKESAFSNIGFTHLSGYNSISTAPIKSSYTTLGSMQEKIKAQFLLVDKLYSIDRTEAAKNLITSHFIPDIVGNLHSFSRQGFRCVSCNAKFRRMPLTGKCTRCGEKILLTISKGSIEKYLKTAITLAERYNVDNYMKQNLELIRREIENLFVDIGEDGVVMKQFGLARFV